MAFPCSTIIDVSPLHLPNGVFCPILVTEFGIVIDDSPLHSKNAFSPMLVTEYVMPLLVTDDGIERLPTGFV